MFLGLSGIFFDNECTQQRLTQIKPQDGISTISSKHDKSLVKGLAFGGNIVVGVARIVQSSQDFHKVCSGDILVTKTTNDEWLVVMKRSAGIITDNGDSCSHAALFGKKNSIPVLVGAGDATEKIKDGDLITLDCTHNVFGYVHSAKKQGAGHNAVTTQKINGGGFCSTFDCASPDQGSGVAVGEASKSSGIIAGIDNVILHDAVAEDSVSSNTGAQLQNNASSHVVFITREQVNRVHGDFVSHVVSNQSKMNKLRWMPFGAGELAINAAVGGLIGDFAVQCVPLSYSFFDQSEAYIKAIIKDLLLDYNITYINQIFEKCGITSAKSKTKGLRNTVARIAHEQHIATIALPETAQREVLKNDPKSYKKIVDQKMVDQKKCHELIAAGMFVDYWLFEKHV